MRYNMSAIAALGRCSSRGGGGCEPLKKLAPHTLTPPPKQEDDKDKHPI